MNSTSEQPGKMARAEALRQRIRQLTSEETSSKDETSKQDIQPGESPLMFIERRSKEIARKKKSDKKDKRS
jgi:hypothetical protein